MFTNVIASSLTLYGKHHFSILLNINLLFYISRVSGWFYLRIRMTVKTCAPSGARARYMTCEAFDLCARRFLHIFVIKPRANAKTIQRFTNIFSNTYPSFYLYEQLIIYQSIFTNILLYLFSFSWQNFLFSVRFFLP